MYNIGSMNDVPNLHVVKKILAILNKPESLIQFVKDRPGHDRRYAMDALKIQKKLGWKPQHTFDEGLKLTVDWYLGNKKWLDRVRSGEYVKYYQKMYSGR